MKKRSPLLFFVLILLIPGMIFIGRIGYLLPLYTDSRTRETVKSALIAVTTREGWLLSDIDMRSVSNDSIRFIHHEHLRGPDPQTCYSLMLNDLSLSPCD